ncbi:dimethylarginine dimethylaminohydrolase family protein [archaeon]
MEEYGTKKAFGRLRSVLMHRPYFEFELIEDPSKWGFASKPNKDLAAEEFDHLVDVLRAERVKVHTVQTNRAPPPNLYYTRDLGVVTTNGIILANFRATYRQGEELYLQIMSDELEIPVFGQVRNVFFEGGDLVQIDDTSAAVGLERTSFGGYQEISEFVDLELLPVPHLEEFAHLDVVFNMVSEKLCVACTKALPQEFLDFLNEEKIEIMDITLEQEKELSADVLMLEPNKVIIGEECREATKALEKRGVEVLPVRLHELKKGKGGPGCLTLTLLRK